MILTILLRRRLLLTLVSAHWACATRGQENPPTHTASSTVTPAPDTRQLPGVGVVGRSTSPDDASELADDSDVNDTDTEVVAPPSQKHPYDGLSDRVLGETLKTHPESLGSISIGTPNSGRLLNGVRPPVSSIYRLVDPEHAWGTEETVRAVCLALNEVAR